METLTLLYIYMHLGYTLSAFLANKERNGNESYPISTTYSDVIRKQKRFHQTTTLSSKLTNEKEIFLRVTSPIKDQNATSGDDVHFKCKVAGWPRQNIQYTWYHNDVKIHPRRFNKHTITRYDWGSKLRVREVYTFDSGSYRCEASNGLRRVDTSGVLQVLFHRPPPRGKKERTDIVSTPGSCQFYSGLVCQEFLNGTKIFVDSDANPTEIERHVTTALDQLGRSKFVSERCRSFAFPSFCHHVFPPCHVTSAGVQAKQLCREECELMKSAVCKDEYLNKDSHQLTKYIFDNANCSRFPPMSEGTCVRVGLHSELIQKSVSSFSDCYHDDGEKYRGSVSVTESGMRCRKWPKPISEKYPDLKEHHFCRNPGGAKGKPWCYIDDSGHKQEFCSIQTCATPVPSAALFLTVSCACALIIVIAVIVTYCYCQSTKKKADTSTPLYSSSSCRPDFIFPFPQVQLPQLNASAVRILADIGVGDYGKAYTGTIVGSLRFPPEETIAVKVLRESCTTNERKAFYDEVQTLSKLNHSNTTNVKGLVFQVTLRCLIFEYTQQVNLLEHILLSKSDCTGKKKFLPSAESEYSHIDNLDLVEMGLQIASGMEYLASNNYIHRDLAARNVLVCGNLDLKISNLGVVKESYLSCYYRSPQGNLIPIRWMAPESLDCWQFSDKSTVWSFGVLLWEMFSYGSHPYCGYSNYEVLEMISRRQLLSCPPNCPTPVFNVMQKCWSQDSNQRPTFPNIRAKLQSWMEAGDVIIVSRQHPRRKLSEDFCDFPPPPKYSSLPSNSGFREGGNCSKSETSYPSFVFPDPDQAPFNKFHTFTNRRHRSPCSSSDALVSDDDELK